MVYTFYEKYCVSIYVTLLCLSFLFFHSHTLCIHCKVAFQLWFSFWKGYRIKIKEIKYCIVFHVMLLILLSFHCLFIYACIFYIRYYIYRHSKQTFSVSLVKMKWFLVFYTFSYMYFICCFTTMKKCEKRYGNRFKHEFLGSVCNSETHRHHHIHPRQKSSTCFRGIRLYSGRHLQFADLTLPKVCGQKSLPLYRNA